MSVRRDLLDNRLLSVLREELLSQDAIREVESLVNGGLAESRKAGGVAASAAKARIQQLDDEIGRMVDAIATVGISPALSERLARAEIERKKLSVVTFSGAAPASDARDVLALIKRRVLAIQDALRDRDTAKARILLREIFGRVVVAQNEDGIFAEFQTSPQRLLLSAASGTDSFLSRVAGIGFEPMTFGL